MTRARRNPSTPPDPLAEVLFRDAQGIAGELGVILDSLAGYDATQVYGVLWKKPDDFRPGASLKFQYIEDVPAPIDMQDICNSAKSRYGGGEYRLSIYANKQLRKQIEFNIYGPPIKPGTAGAPTPAGDAMNAKDLFGLLISQQAEARREMQVAQETARREAADERRERADQEARRTDRMMQLAAVVAPIALPLFMGNREKLSDVVAMMRGEKTELKDQVETFVMLKGLFAGEGGGQAGAGFDPDDVVGSIMRGAGPILAAAGRALNGRGGPPPPTGEADGEGAPLMLPQPDPAPAPAAFEPVAPAPAGSSPPILELIRPHVAYFYNAHLDPGLAAEAIADILERAAVTEDDINGLVASFALSADWLADLAAHGLDLRGNPEWAETFLAELTALWQDDHTGDNGSAGLGGGGGDAADHAPARQGRVKANGSARPGA